MRARGNKEQEGNKESIKSEPMSTTHSVVRTRIRRSSWQTLKMSDIECKMADSCEADVSVPDSV